MAPLRTIDGWKTGTKELYAVRFENAGYYDDGYGKPLAKNLVDEYTSYLNKITYHELIRLVDAQVPVGMGGADLDSMPVYNLIRQDDIPLGGVAHCVVATYTEVEYTFGISVDEKRVIAVCANEVDAHELRRQLYALTADSSGDALRRIGFSGDTEIAFGVIELKVG